MMQRLGTDPVLDGITATMHHAAYGVIMLRIGGTTRLAFGPRGLRMTAVVQLVAGLARGRSEVRKAQRLKTLEGLRDNCPKQVLLAFREVSNLIRSGL